MPRYISLRSNVVFILAKCSIRIKNYGGKMEKSKAVIYARFSCEKQREESIEGQIRVCTGYADYNDIEIVATYCDRAISGRTDDRHEFERMMKECVKMNINYILVWKLDRFARNRYDSSYHKYLLKKRKIKVISVTEPIPDSPEGILLESFLEGLAEYYSANLATNVKRGMTENALKGLWNGGSVPLGYKVNSDRKLEVDPESALIVKEIYKLYSDGSTIMDIFNYLNKMHITRPNGHPLSYNAIRKVLTNRLYIGEYNHSGIKIENAIEPIVSVEMFDIIQSKLARNTRAPARRTAKEEYLLTTKLFCGKCGAMMVAQSGTSKTGRIHKYYACTRQKKHLCDKRMLHKDQIESFVVRKTMEMLTKPKMIDKLSKMLFDLQNEESSLLASLERQYKEKEKEINNLLNAVQKGLATDILLTRLDELGKERDAIAESIAKEEIKTPIFTQQQFNDALNHFKNMDITTDEGKRKIIDTFVNAIYAYDDHIKIIYNTNGKEESISLDEIKSSTSFSSSSPNANSLNFFTTQKRFGLFCFLEEVKKY